ncbi:MAG: cupin domain-containing protein [Pedosphaera sp.]|nr:cupin domain-containing protein [Pedosphaera sp.]
MKKINLAAVPVEESQSPKGRYRRFCKDITAAMRQTNGERLRPLAWPFEVELVRLPPRALNYPLHSHTAQWEFYLIVSGRGQVRTPAGTVEVREGDCVAHPPGEAHQLSNTGATDLVYYVIADNPPSDACHYPDSDKWALPGQDKPVRVQSAEYYDGEE